ncbi:TetR/AcrR family transcriptional regulator [Streptomyces sp. A7024]|uniref:TetR/AcrR family transcriptional regulator n=1 Tax=Streptomyces coryli TaxID=1128680 RepID=A0A6G4UF24_9ACTN|nr:TetR/AcrR family transcriptional regulator [Streptomyces coryli]NGN70412.1 TetR/AcrR family transcriptional regulator [Streptomyces coryli]
MPPEARRPAAGAAVLRPDVTDAIRDAVLQELAEVGYGRLSIERVARRAGVGKAAVYRRWPSKLPIVLDVVSGLAAQSLPTPDTGSLYGDVRALLDVTAKVLQHPMAAQILPDLLAEAARSPELGQTLQSALREAQHGIVTAMVGRAADRGELAARPDPDVAMDLLAGPLYWRLMLDRTRLPAAYLDRLANAVVAALAAAE